MGWMAVAETNKSAAQVKSLGERILDEDHEEIESRVEAFQTAIVHGKGMYTIYDAAETLISATLEHFRHEEEVLKRAGYRWLAEHRAAHAKLLDELHEIHKGIQRREIQSALELARLYGSSLKEHEDTHDEKYREAIRQASRTAKLMA